MGRSRPLYAVGEWDVPPGSSPEFKLPGPLDRLWKRSAVNTLLKD